MNLLDLIFPKKCVSCRSLGNYLCSNCSSKIEYLDLQICARCYKSAVLGITHPICQSRFGLDGVVSFCNYSGPIKALIKNLKYKFTIDLLGDLGSVIKLDKKLLPARYWKIVPIPLHKLRQNYRGFNQAEVLGELIAKKLNLAFDSKLLIRKSATRRQVGLSQIQRRENTRDVFEVLGEVRNQSFYVFDDVWTSGATLKSAAKALKRAGADQVWGLTLAHPR